MPRGINGTSVSVTLAGVVLAYSGLKGKRITTTVRDLIAGKNPSDNKQTDQPIVDANLGALLTPPSGGSGSGPAPSLPDILSPGPTTQPPIVAGHAMTARQIYDTARSAGFDPVSAVVATAVAFAESRGNPNNYNGVPPDNSYGLWQINMIGTLGPARRAQFGLTDNAQLFNPSVNAHAAYVISHGGRNWQPWTTFTSGAYLKNLPAARAAAHG